MNGICPHREHDVDIVAWLKSLTPGFARMNRGLHWYYGVAAPERSL